MCIGRSVEYGRGNSYYTPKVKGFFLLYFCFSCFLWLNKFKFKALKSIRLRVLIMNFLIGAVSHGKVGGGQSTN